MRNNLRFRRFKPNAGLARHVSEVFLHLIEYIPLGAEVSAHFTKIKGRYLCSLDIEASDGTFSEKIISGDPDSALDLVTDKIKRRIRSWQQGHMAFTEPSFWEFKEVIND